MCIETAATLLQGPRGPPKGPDGHLGYMMAHYGRRPPALWHWMHQGDHGADAGGPEVSCLAV